MIFFEQIMNLAMNQINFTFLGFSCHGQWIVFGLSANGMLYNFLSGTFPITSSKTFLFL